MDSFRVSLLDSDSEERNFSTPILTPQVSQYERTITVLSSMGFDERSIEKAMRYTQSSSIEEALTCLIKGPDGWEHSFIPDQDNPEICFVCRDSSVEHIESFQNNNTDSLLQSIRMSQDFFGSRFSKELYQGPLCLICYETPLEPWSHPNCSTHLFCRNCIIQYLELKISESDVRLIRSPAENCPEVFSPDLIKSLVSTSMYQKYLKFKKRDELNENENLRWCIRPDCEGYVIGIPDFSTKLICPSCEMQICFKCGEEWHGRQTCEEMVDRAYEDWAKGKEVQLCPTCKRRIEKIDGCNHMTCSVCEYEWCWLCRGKYTENHFSSFNPFGCPNLEGGGNTREEWTRSRIFCLRLKFFCMWIGLILFFPLVLLSLPGIYSFKKTYVVMELEEYNLALRFIISSLVFLGVFSLTPIAYGIAVPALFCVGVFWVFKRVRNWLI